MNAIRVAWSRTGFVWSVAVPWHLAAVAACVALAVPAANAAQPSLGGELVAPGLLTVNIAGQVRRRPVRSFIRTRRRAVYGGQLRLAAFDGRVRVISGYDGATERPDAAIGAVDAWRFDSRAAPDSAGIADGASRQRVEIDVLKLGAAHVSTYGRHRASGRRFRLGTDGLGPDQDSVGYGVDAAFNALSLRFGYDTSDSDGDVRTGAPAFQGSRDSIRARLSLDAVRPAHGLGQWLLPGKLGYDRIDRRRVSFDAADGDVTARESRMTDKISFDWPHAFGATRLAIARTRVDDAQGPAGGARTFVVVQRLTGRRWHGRLHLGFGTRTAPHAATPWSGDIYSGGIAATLAPRGLPHFHARFDVARFAMHMEPARRGADWRLATALDFGALAPHLPGRTTQLRLSASVGQGSPLKPAPDTARQLDGTVMLDAGFTF